MEISVRWELWVDRLFIMISTLERRRLVHNHVNRSKAWISNPIAREASEGTAAIFRI